MRAKISSAGEDMVEHRLIICSGSFAGIIDNFLSAGMVGWTVYGETVLHAGLDSVE